MDLKKEAYPESMIATYNSLLEAYPFHHLLRKEVAALLHEHIKETPESLVLEIGCGSGETTEYIVRQNNNMQLVALDNNKLMIEGLQNKFQEEIRLQQVIPLCENIFSYMPSIPDGHFHGITSSWTIHNFSRKERFSLLNEIYRTLKPGGIFVNMDKYVDDDSQKEQESFDAVASYMKLHLESHLAEMIINHEEEDRHQDIIMRQQESLHEMNGIGFKKITFHTRIGREVVMSCVK